MKINLKIFALFFTILPTIVFAQEKATSYIPLIQYDYFNATNQTLKNKTFGLMTEKENLSVMAFFSLYEFEKDLLFDYPKSYTSLDFITEYNKDKSLILFVYSSYTDRPEKMEVETLQSAFVYGHKFIDEENFSLIFGGGIAVSDFGIEYEDGKPWVLLPVPFLRINKTGKLFKSKFEFITSPNLELTLLPKNKIRASFDGRIDEFRDDRDMIFTAKLHYRFFDETHKLGDFAGVALGFKNDSYGGFDLTKRNYNSSDDTESVELQYNSIFAELDLSALTISYGYTFNARELYYNGDSKTTKTIDDGYVFSVQGAWEF